MIPIGGYFELELPKGTCYHKDAIALNTGRNCLEYILRVHGYYHVYLPYYTCDVILEPFKKLGIKYSFYRIDLNLELVDEIVLGEGEALLVTNYYGLKQEYIKDLASKYGQRLIVDNSQAFFAEHFDGIDTFYSCRKFFGVPDGAYLYCDKQLDMDLEQDQSWDRMNYLLKRIDLSPEEGYADFRNQSEHLINQPIMLMSSLTERIMSSIDYKYVAKRRRENYKILCDTLNSTNDINISFDNESVPMVYPYLTEKNDLRKLLIVNKIYVAQYWPNVQRWVNEESNEYYYTTHLLPLPIDQRYGKENMMNLISVVKKISH